MDATPVDEFERLLRLNLRPLYLLSAAAIPKLIEAGGGSIVGVSAKAAFAPFSGAAGYITSKAAVWAFISALATEYKDDAIRANAILPSVIDTPPGNRESQPDSARKLGVTGDDRRNRRLSGLRRLRRGHRSAGPPCRASADGLTATRVGTRCVLGSSCGARLPTHSAVLSRECRRGARGRRVRRGGGRFVRLLRECSMVRGNAPEPFCG